VIPSSLKEIKIQYPIEIKYNTKKKVIKNKLSDEFETYEKIFIPWIIIFFKKYKSYNHLFFHIDSKNNNQVL
jgi:hypothetical protein